MSGYDVTPKLTFGSANFNDPIVYFFAQGISLTLVEI
jgi:hypothetical protein